MRWRSALPTVCSAFALAACGGDGGGRAEQQTVASPTIDRAVANDLAARSEGIANRLDAGDACGARAEADVLRADLTQAINDGAIPATYLEDLSGLVNEIHAGIPPCQPPPPIETHEDDKKKDEDKKDDEDKKEGEGKKEEHKKEKDNGDGDD